MVEQHSVRLSELLGLYKAQHSLFGECPSCGEVFRFSDIRTWHGTPPRDWLTAMRELQKELKAGYGTKPRPKRKPETFVRLT